MYEYRYNIIYYNIIPVLVITSWIFGWFTVHLFTFYVLFLTLVSLTFHNSNFDNRVTSHLSTSIVEGRIFEPSIHPSIHPTHVFRQSHVRVVVFPCGERSQHSTRLVQ
jgi:hypothetical protein